MVKNKTLQNAAGVLRSYADPYWKSEMEPIQQIGHTGGSPVEREYNGRQMVVYEK